MSDEIPAFTFRKVAPDDLPMLAEWWVSHDSLGPFPEAILPPLGVMVWDESGPAAALWCYECFGVGVAFLEFPVSRPGMGFKAARAAFEEAVKACVKLAGKLIEPPGDYGVFRCFTLRPIAKTLKGLGFEIEQTDRVAATLILPT